MPYQSKTYSLSDEVIAAIEAAREQGLTPNRFLRRVLGLDGEVLAKPGFVRQVKQIDVELTRERKSRRKNESSRRERI